MLSFADASVLRVHMLGRLLLLQPIFSLLFQLIHHIFIRAG